MLQIQSEDFAKRTEQNENVHCSNGSMLHYPFWYFGAARKMSFFSHLVRGIGHGAIKEKRTAHGVQHISKKKYMNHGCNFFNRNKTEAHGNT